MTRNGFSSGKVVFGAPLVAHTILCAPSSGRFSLLPPCHNAGKHPATRARSTHAAADSSLACQTDCDCVPCLTLRTPMRLITRASPFIAVVIVAVSFFFAWVVKTDADRVLWKCLHYAKYFESIPRFRFSLTSLHCEFQEEEIREDLRRPHRDDGLI